MTLLDDLQAQGLPVISVSPTNEITMGEMTDDQRRLYRAVLLHYFNPYEYPDIVEVVRYRIDLKDNFTDTITHLYEYANWHNASLPELRVQMKYISLLLYKLMRALELPVKSIKD